MDFTLPDGSTFTVPDAASAAPAAAPYSPSAIDYVSLFSPQSVQSSPYVGLSDPANQIYANSYQDTSSSPIVGNAVANAFSAPQAGSGGGGTNGALAQMVDQAYGQGQGQAPTPSAASNSPQVDANGVQLLPAGMKVAQMGAGNLVLGTDGHVYSTAKPQQTGSIYGTIASLLSGNIKGAMSDPKGMMGALALMGSLASLASKPKAPPTPAQLMMQLPQSPYNNFTPQGQAMMDNFMQNFSPVVKNIRPATYRNYAEGGGVEAWPDTDEGGRIPWEHGAPARFKSGGALSLVNGPGGGQDDLVKAHLSPGEYVMDADVVSALGDGSNEAGAKKLDQMREHIRAHNRSAPPGEIPPKAKGPLEYLKK